MGLEMSEDDWNDGGGHHLHVTCSCSLIQSGDCLRNKGGFLEEVIIEPP